MFSNGVLFSKMASFHFRWIPTIRSGHFTSILYWCCECIWWTINSWLAARWDQVNIRDTRHFNGQSVTSIIRISMDVRFGHLLREVTDTRPNLGSLCCQSVQRRTDLVILFRVTSSWLSLILGFTPPIIPLFHHNFTISPISIYQVRCIKTRVHAKFR